MYSFSALFSTLVVALVASVGVQAERHVVHFDNRCGYGTPTLIQGGRVLSTGGDYVSNGPLVAAIAYLQTGACGFNGENCSLLETTLKNPTCAGCGSSTDVSLIPPHKFSVTTGFGYYNGCDGTGNNCKSAGCCPGGAFCTPTDYQSQRQCQANDSPQTTTATKAGKMASGLDTPELYANGTNGTPVLNSDAALPIPPAPASSFDPAQFRTYLLALLPPVIGATVDEIEATLFDSEFDEKSTRFAAEGVEAIYIVKTRAGEPEEDATPTYSYTLTQQLQYNSSNVTTLALIKRTPTLDTLLPLAPQLHILNLFGGDETPYESLHAVVSQAVKPWFDAFVGARGSGKDGDGKMGIPVTKKKFAELELSLLHLQQNVEIPETHLIIHPSIQKAVDHAHATNTPVHIDLIPGSTLSDSSFLNTLQAHVNTWIKSIQGVTKLTRDVSSGTASQEINFWLSLERALEGIETQLRGDEVQLVMECLRNAKRFRATVSFIADTGLKEATDIVHKYNQLMKEFPLNELLSATDLDKIHDALYQVFGHINRKLRLSPYPIRRALPLVEAISRDFNDQLLRVLTSHRLTYAPYETFDRLLKQTQEIFRAWDDLIKEFTNVAREVTRRRSEKFIPIKVQPAHAKLMERTRYLRDWRKQHEQLAVMTGPTKGLGGIGKDVGGMDMEEEVKEAYEIVKGIDVLDVSTEGTEIWVTAENAYNERVARVENQIISRLRDRLGTARNANEMFRVFSKFNALFVRPKIRGAIQEYQTQLIESVKEDIKRLHDKFKTQYRYSDTYHMSQMRDLPPIAGAIIWARQIERQLNTYMTRVQDVLGKSWELYAEGQKLQAESTSFRKKLDTRPVYEAWLHDINRRDMNINGRLFEIIRLRGGGFQLTVNFDPQIITLFKEVRNLLWLGFQVPHTTSNLAKDAKRVYPHAVSLMETVRTYAQTLDLVEANKGIEMLVAEYRNEVQRMITRGMALRWDFFVNTYDSHRFHGTGLDGRENKHIVYVREFASAVSILQDKTNSLIDVYKDITRHVDDLATCPFTTEAFSELIAKIQAAASYANLDNWVAELDAKIEALLLVRLTHIIQLWCTEFDRTEEDEPRREVGVIRDATMKKRAERRKDEKAIEGNLTLKPIVHEIRIQNQVIFLDPPIEYARGIWIRQLHSWLGVVCGLRRIQSSRYEIGLQMQGAMVVDTTYTGLLTRLNESTLVRPFDLVETKVQQVKEYVAKWLQFQSLWDLEAEYVFTRLGDSLANWQQLLTEIKRTRQTFDNSDTQRSFGVCVIDYEQVQARVNAKYDSWQRDILQRFGVKLANEMKEMHAAITKARHDMEQQSMRF
ncbi:dynein heavy chain, partial [Rhizoctonia solani]